MGRKLAGSLMKEQGLVSCQPLTLPVQAWQS
ncbi:transposase, IS3 family [Escherichia coli]|nr:transposase, IS3 family [Escherichia coli]